MAPRTNPGDIFSIYVQDIWTYAYIYVVCGMDLVSPILMDRSCCRSWTSFLPVLSSSEPKLRPQHTSYLWASQKVAWFDATPRNNLIFRLACPQLLGPRRSHISPFSTVQGISLGLGLNVCVSNGERRRVRSAGRLVGWCLIIQHSGQHSGLTHRNTPEKTCNRAIVQATTAWTRTLPCLLL